jgi:hypothetical protein
LPDFILALVVSGAIYFLGEYLNLNYLVELIIQTITAIILFVTISEATRMTDYLYIKGILFEKLKINSKNNG